MPVVVSLIKILRGTLAKINGDLRKRLYHNILTRIGKRFFADGNAAPAPRATHFVLDPSEKSKYHTIMNNACERTLFAFEMPSAAA
jgi:hypothetical protein